MFNLFEIASFLGRPVCLYEFIWGNTIWRYTSADRDVPWGGETYAKLPISDSGFTQGVNSQDFTITLPRATELVQLFRQTPPAEEIAIICRRFHKDDISEEAVVYWSGTVGNVRGVDAIKAEIIGIPLSNTMRRTGLRLCWERGCPHALYDEGCRVNKNSFRTTTTITALTGTQITVATLGAWGANRYSGGFIEWEANEDGTIDRRAIESSAGGNALNLLGTTDRLVVGQAVTLYLGCDLTAQTCQEVFNNLPNHGGFEMLAGKSPFDGNPVF